MIEDSKPTPPTPPARSLQRPSSAEHPSPMERHRRRPRRRAARRPNARSTTSPRSICASPASSRPKTCPRPRSCSSSRSASAAAPRSNVFAGIKEAYKPRRLVGRLVICVANLAPRQDEVRHRAKAWSPPPAPAAPKCLSSPSTKAPCPGSACINAYSRDQRWPGCIAELSWLGYVIVHRVRFEVFKFAKRQRPFVRCGEDHLWRARRRRALPASAVHTGTSGCPAAGRGSPIAGWASTGRCRPLWKTPGTRRSARRKPYASRRLPGPCCSSRRGKSPSSATCEQTSSLPPSTFLAFGKRTTPLVLAMRIMQTSLITPQADFTAARQRNHRRRPGFS